MLLPAPAGSAALADVRAGSVDRSSTLLVGCPSPVKKRERAETPNADCGTGIGPRCAGRGQLSAQRARRRAAGRRLGRVADSVANEQTYCTAALRASRKGLTARVVWASNEPPW